MAIEPRTIWPSEARTEHLGELASLVSHDLQDPLDIAEDTDGTCG